MKYGVPQVKTLIVPDLIPDSDEENETFQLVVFYFALEGYCIYQDLVARGFYDRNYSLDSVPEKLKKCDFDFDSAYQNWQSIGVSRKVDDELLAEVIGRLQFGAALARLVEDKADQKYLLDRIIIQTWQLLYEYLDQIISKEECIHLMLLQMLPAILEHKIKIQKPFGNFEKVFEYFTEEDQIKALFHLDVLR